MKIDKEICFDCIVTIIYLISFYCVKFFRAVFIFHVWHLEPNVFAYVCVDESSDDGWLDGGGVDHRAA